MRVDIFRMLAGCNKCINQQGNLLVGLAASGAVRSGAELCGVLQCVEWQCLVGWDWD